MIHRPDDDNDAVEDVVRVPQVLKEAKSCELKDHLQGEHAGEDNVTDLQDVGQLFRLGGRAEERWQKNKTAKIKTATRLRKVAQTERFLNFKVQVMNTSCLNWLDLGNEIM